MKHTINSSKKVILDCILDNGGIVAANATKSYYPAAAHNYFFVWPRDASYSCIALTKTGETKAQHNFFKWITTRAEGWKESGAFWQAYNPNGSLQMDRTKFQPDQAGTVLLAVCHYIQKNKVDATKYKKLIEKTAGGLCDVWKIDHFTIKTNDLWEEKNTFPDVKDSFSYSVAACIRGLECANKMFPNKLYEKTANQMKTVMMKKIRKIGFVPKSFGDIDNKEADASSLGLIWPFKIIDAKSAIAKNTVKHIEKNIVENYGVHRYANDRYDGWFYKGGHRKEGSGYWPLLNFWMAIVLNKQGRKVEAMKYYDKVMKDTGKYIPEQVFDNDIQKGVSPLCWSHAMHILAAQHLGLDK